MEDFSRSLNFSTETHRNFLTHEKVRATREEFKKADIVLKLNDSIIFIKKSIKFVNS